MNPTNSAEALSNLQSFSSGRTSLADLYSGAEKETGVADARTRAQQLKQAASATEGLIRNVDPSVTGRLQGGLATEAQRQRLIALETQPLTEMYRTQSGAYDTANTELSDAASRADKLATMRYGADTDKFNSLKTLYDTLYGQEQAAEEKRRWEAQQAEAKRQFDAQIAETRRAAESAAAAARFSPSYNMPSATPAAGSAKAAESQQQRDYNFVKGLVNATNAHDDNIGNTLVGILNNAKAGDERSKAIMRSYYQMRGTPIPKGFQGFLGA